MDRTIRLWRLPDGRPLEVLKKHRHVVNCLAVSPGGRLLASSSHDGTVCLWSLPLLALQHVPISRTTLHDLTLAQEALQEGFHPADFRSHLQLLATLMRWRRRQGYDILIEEPVRQIQAGEFDIEIEGRAP
jgi:WD40 repeat protein